MEFECKINRKSAKEIYKKAGRNIGSKIIKFALWFEVICVLVFLLVKDILMISFVASVFIVTVICWIIYYQKQLNMICPKKKEGSSEYLQKVAFHEDEIVISGDVNDISCGIEYKRIKKYYSSQHYFIFITKGGMLFCVEKSRISSADREKFAEIFRTKMPQLKLPWELQRSVY